MSEMTAHVKQPARRNRGRAQKNRGYRSEHEAEKTLARFGFRRNPLSGAAKHWPGDLIRQVADGRCLRVIGNKRRQKGWKVLRQWLEQERAQCLRLDPGFGLTVGYWLPEEVFLKLLEEAGYEIQASDKSDT
ncbi:MAG: hypothetical protein AB1563_00140 [Bacillota bacterium]